VTLFFLEAVLLASSRNNRERIGEIVAILLLLFFAAIGIDMIFHPRRHMNTYLRRGGEMLQELDELGVQLVGLIFTCGSGWLLYQLVPSVWQDWLR
jgi:hypothetical protein